MRLISGSRLCPAGIPVICPFVRFNVRLIIEADSNLLQ